MTGDRLDEKSNVALGEVLTAGGPLSMNVSTGAPAVTVTVTGLELTMPSFAWYVKLSVPVNPGAGVYVNEPSAFSVSDPFDGPLMRCLRDLRQVGARVLSEGEQGAVTFRP